MRPQTSGKPGQRGYHGIGSYKPTMGASASNADDLDEMLDAVGGHDPLTVITQKKATTKQRQQKAAAPVEEDDNDPLGFLKKAAEEQKKNEERRK